MKYLSSVALLACCASAFPALDTPENRAKIEARDTHPFIPAAGADLRSPCPGTNTLANHGYINRNGAFVTAQAYQQGFLDAFGYDFDVTSAGVNNAFSLCKSITGQSCNSINLTMLSVPHAIEHDGSLSRLDKEMANNRNANNQLFNQGIWNMALAVYGSKPHIGAILAHTAQVTRYNQAKQNDYPGWFSASGIGGSNTEAAFYLSVFNDPTQNVSLNTPGANPQARMDWVNHMFTEMELPTALGWQRPAQTITGPQIASLASFVNAQPTATAAPGTNPYIVNQKRDVIEQPTPSWKRDLMARGISPDAISSAAASASAIAGPAPAVPNPYFDEVSADDWTNIRSATASHVSKVENLFQSLLNSTTS